MRKYLIENGWSTCYNKDVWLKDEDKDLMNNLPLERAFKTAIRQKDYNEIVKIFTEDEIKYIRAIN